MVGGQHAVFKRALPVLEAMGKKENIVYVGPSGSGEIIKIVNNMLVGTITAATAVTLALLRPTNLLNWYTSVAGLAMTGSPMRLRRISSANCSADA